MLTFKSYCDLLVENFNEINFTPEQIAAMRDWVADCNWQDLEPEDIAALPDEQIIKGVNKHYAGGLAAFLRAL